MTRRTGQYSAARSSSQALRRTHPYAALQTRGSSPSARVNRKPGVEPRHVRFVAAILIMAESRDQSARTGPHGSVTLLADGPKFVLFVHIPCSQGRSVEGPPHRAIPPPAKDLRCFTAKRRALRVLRQPDCT